MQELSADDIDLLITSLDYFKMRIRDYDGYPDEEFRAQRLQDVDQTLAKLREARSAA